MRVARVPTGVSGIDRAGGCLLGLACGDALGRPVEGRSGAEIGRHRGRVTEMRADGTYGRPAGTVTDETTLALRAARSLVDRGGFDRADLAGRFGARDRPTGVDPATAAALRRLDDAEEAGPRTPAGADDAHDAAGAVLARTVPYAIAYRDAPERLAAVVEAATALTYDAPRAVGASVALARVVAELFGGADPEAALDAALGGAARRDDPADVRTTLATATDPTMASPGPGGGAVATLETALHDGLTAATAEDAVVTAVGRGGRTTATGAAAGAVAGARFGADALPPRWLDHLDEAAECQDLAAALDEGPFD